MQPVEMTLDKIGKISYVTKTFHDYCILAASVCSTGFRGGDSGSGGFTEIILSLGGGDMRSSFEEEPTRLGIRFGGDAELRVAAQAFRFIAESLEKMAK